MSACSRTICRIIVILIMVKALNAVFSGNSEW